ncbi:MAG: archease [Firmicutes bacterium]|nr:archease [Bacillota bacterium]
MGFKIIDHTADVGIEAAGSTIGSLFENCALGMISLMIKLSPENNIIRKTVTININGTDDTDILYGFLSEVLYLFEGENFVPESFSDTSLENGKFSTLAEGCEIIPAQAEFLHEIKAVTFHGMEITQQNGEWKTQVIFDI